MGKPFLSVAIYRLRYGNFQHWALHLHTDFEDLIYEADGEHPSFIKATSVGNPTDKSFIGSFYVGEIGIPDIATVKRIVDEARVDNETLEWDCQDYVLEILETWSVRQCWTRKISITQRSRRFSARNEDQCCDISRWLHFTHAYYETIIDILETGQRSPHCDATLSRGPCFTVGMV